MKQSLLILLLLLIWPGVYAYAECRGGMFGASSDGYLMSSTDVTMSFTYSLATTSGTSGCRNWDFAKHLEEARLWFLVRNQDALSEDIAQGSGKHLSAFTELMGCPASTEKALHDMLQSHQQELLQPLKNHHDAKDRLQQLYIWMQQHDEVQRQCVTLNQPIPKRMS